AAGRLRAAQSAARAAPGSEPALAELSEAALVAGRLDEAGAAADELIRRTPTDVNPRVTRAAVYVQRGEWAKAEAACREALAVHPLYSQARIYLALCKHRLGDPVGGRAEAQAAAALLPNPAQRTALLEWYNRETKDRR
ncbi:MAG: tetratricopeptide repeat protein, partial [Gemmataceae bacterium]|nr:tetratricopeptide repeat protein [Gemmataceae bacterium]